MKTPSKMASTLVIILFSLFILDLVFMSPSALVDGRNPSPEDQMQMLGESTNVFQEDDTKVLKDNSSTTDVSNLYAEKMEISFLPTSNPFLEYLGRYAGYYTLPQGTRTRMFYYFLNPEDKIDKPVIIWLGGESGVSSNVALFYENGPIHFANDSSLLWNAYGWNTVANILYVDQPIGTGFSYTSNYRDIRTNKIQVIDDLYNFLQSFFKHYHDYVTNDFYICGQSYAGQYAHALAFRIHRETKARRGININLKGVAVGNSLIDLGIQYETIPWYAHSRGLITQEDYSRLHDLTGTCKSSIVKCERGFQGMCVTAFHDCDKILQDTISKIGNTNYLDVTKLRQGDSNYDYSKMVAFLNTQPVKQALGLPGSPFVLYNSDVYEALKFERALSTQLEISTLLDAGIKLLSYAGDNDLLFNYMGTMMALLNIKWSGQDDFDKSSVLDLFDKDDAGLRRTHGPLTYIKVCNAGSMVSMDQPELSLEMITSWIRGDFQ